MLDPKLQFIYRGAKTKRYHTADTLTSQTVGEHSFGVAWLVVLLCPDARKELILAALAHDLAEHQVGDVSSPTKKKHPEIKEFLDATERSLLASVGLDFETKLFVYEKRVLKAADILDGMMFCLREFNMGSRAVIDVYLNFKSYYVAENFIRDNIGVYIFNNIDEEWSKLCRM